MFTRVSERYTCGDGLLASIILMYNRGVATAQVATWHGKPPRPARTPARHRFNHTMPG